MLGLLLLPGITFAGGAGNLSLYNSPMSAPMMAPVAAPDVSSENPISILESRNNAGATIDRDLLQYSFGYIPNSFWASYSGDLEDINGFIEAEEYFGETIRAQYGAGQSNARETERQNRAQNKAMRLRFVGR